MKKSVAVEVGDQVFVGTSTDSFGAVREVHAHGLLIDIEGLGDVKIPAAAVEDVHDHKIVLSMAALPDDVRKAIAHAHDRETQ